MSRWPTERTSARRSEQRVRLAQRRKEPLPDVVRCALIDVDVEQWDPRAGASPTSTSSAQFDLSDPRTVVGPGEHCAVCDELLVAGEVFVLGSWDGRVGPAHEDCPRVLDELLADNKKRTGFEEPARAPVERSHGG